MKSTPSVQAVMVRAYFSWALWGSPVMLLLVFINLAMAFTPGRPLIFLPIGFLMIALMGLLFVVTVVPLTRIEMVRNERLRGEDRGH